MYRVTVNWIRTLIPGWIAELDTENHNLPDNFSLDFLQLTIYVLSRRRKSFGPIKRSNQGAFGAPIRIFSLRTVYFS